MHVSQETQQRKKHRLPPVLEGTTDHVSTKRKSIFLHHVVVIPHTEEALLLPDKSGKASLFSKLVCASSKEAPSEEEVMRQARLLASSMACEPMISNTQLKAHGLLHYFDKKQSELHHIYVVFAQAQKIDVGGFVPHADIEALLTQSMSPMTKDIIEQLHEDGFFADALTRAIAIPESRLPAETPKKEKPSKPKHASNPPTAKPANQEKKMQTTASTHPLLASGKPLSIILPMFGGQVMLGGSDEFGSRTWSVLHKSMCIESMHAGDDAIHAMRHARQLPDFIGLRHLKSVKYGEQPITVYVAELSSIQAQYSRGLRFIPRREVEEVLSGNSKIHDDFTSFVFSELRSLLLPPLPEKQVRAAN